MKKLLVALVALLSLSCTALAEKPKPPNPADFTVTVHVVFSHFIPTRDTTAGYQELDTIIDGQQVELRCYSAQGVLTLGDYKAKRIDSGSWKGGFFPMSPTGFDIYRLYDLLMPDGMSREFEMVGLGPSAQAPPAPANP